MPTIYHQYSSITPWDIIGKNTLMNWGYVLKQSVMKMLIDGSICILLMIRCKKYYNDPQH